LFDLNKQKRCSLAGSALRRFKTSNAGAAGVAQCHSNGAPTVKRTQQMLPAQKKRDVNSLSRSLASGIPKGPRRVRRPRMSTEEEVADILTTLDKAGYNRWEREQALSHPYSVNFLRIMERRRKS
jgi:hypothetical protein